jgi:hypothetical protein
MMLVPVILFPAGSLSSAVAGPHARLKSSKNWAKKARFLEVVSSECSPPSSSTAFNRVSVVTKPNIFDSLTDDEAVGFLIVPYAIISQLTAPGLGYQLPPQSNRFKSYCGRKSWRLFCSSSRPGFIC